MTATQNHQAIAANAPAKAERNPMANAWLGILTVVFALFATCTLVLVAWPVLAWLGARLGG